MGKDGTTQTVVQTQVVIGSDVALYEAGQNVQYFATDEFHYFRIPTAPKGQRGHGKDGMPNMSITLAGTRGRSGFPVPLMPNVSCVVRMSQWDAKA